MQRRKRTTFIGAVHKDFQELLKNRYRPGQEFLEALNGYGTWNEHRRLLEKRKR